MYDNLSSENLLYLIASVNLRLLVYTRSYTSPCLKYNVPVIVVAHSDDMRLVVIEVIDEDQSSLRVAFCIRYIKGPK